MSSAWRYVLATLALALAACVAPAGRTGTEPDSSGEVSRGPKVLTIAIQTELKGFVRDYTGETSGIGGVSQPPQIVHNLLVADNGMGIYTPVLATEKPAVDKGTWVLLPDGGMEVTWKLRPNVKWHDGAPFTADDLVFSAHACLDPQIPCLARASIRAISNVTAADATTFVVRWSAPYVLADQAEGLVPLPKHLMDELYRTDKPNFALSPRFSTEFVGLGPYRLQRWEPGSHLEMSRFDDYYQGRPPLDQVIVKFLGDTNTMVAAIMAGAVDAVLPLGVSVEQAIEVRDRWQGTGNQVVIARTLTLYSLYYQMRPDLARPTNGAVNPVVRRAIYHTIDRPQMIEAGLAGLAPVADSWLAQSDPLRPQVESAIPQYPLDVARSQQLFAEAGWTRGSDGVLVYPGTGERFEIELSGAPRQDTQRMQAVMREQFKAVGVDAVLYNFPAALASDNEVRSTRPGVTLNGTGSANFFTSTMYSSRIPGPENRWGGSNWGGYNNPRVDALLDRLNATIPPTERLPLQRELLQVILGDVALAPVYWNVVPVLALAGVKGFALEGGTSGQTWNFFEWDKRQ
jgi:peptide/nickel transport system substrate-binding protein